MNSKLALGTAQFGLDYGVANQLGQVCEIDVKNILATAGYTSILTLDTAIAYGESESVLGRVGVDNFDVVTKLSTCEGVDHSMIKDWVFESIQGSLRRLNLRNLYGVLLHRPLELLSDKGNSLYDGLVSLKERNITGKIGISVYEPSDLDKIIPNFDVDLVQLPLNVIDGRWDEWLTKLHQDGVEVHVRSVFLQGVLLMSKDKLPVKFARWRGLWERWDAWILENNVSSLTACLHGLINKPEISKVIVGVDSTRQLKEIVQVLNSTSDIEIPERLKVKDPILLNPSNWNQL